MSVLPNSIKQIICEPIDPSLIRYKEVQKKSYAYVSGATVCDILNRAFGYDWNWITEKEWVQESVPYYNKYAKDEEGKIVGALEEQGPVAHVRGVLTVYFEDEAGNRRSISKTGYGAQPIVGKQSEQESAFKGADTDALKKAASRIGVAAELYRSEEEQNFFDNNFNPSVWTESAQAYYADQINYLYGIIESKSEDEFNKQIHDFNPALHTIDDITPINIEEVVDGLGYGAN